MIKKFDLKSTDLVADAEAEEVKGPDALLDDEGGGGPEGPQPCQLGPRRPSVVVVIAAAAAADVAAAAVVDVVPGAGLPPDHHVRHGDVLPRAAAPAGEVPHLPSDLQPLQITSSIFLFLRRSQFRPFLVRICSDNCKGGIDRNSIPTNNKCVQQRVHCPRLVEEDAAVHVPCLVALWSTFLWGGTRRSRDWPDPP